MIDDEIRRMYNKMRGYDNDIVSPERPYNQPVRHVYKKDWQLIHRSEAMIQYGVTLAHLEKLCLSGDLRRVIASKNGSSPAVFFYIAELDMVLQDGDKEILPEEPQEEA